MLARFIRSIAVVLLATAWPAPIEAQQVPFDFRVRQPGSAFTIANGAQVNLVASAVGARVSVSFDITYRGTTRVEFATGPRLLGSTTFRVTGLETTPAALEPGQTVTLEVAFVPTSTAQALAQVALTFVQQPTQPGAQPLAGVIQFDLRGLVPELAASYALQEDGNVLPLPDGARLDFGPTQTNTTGRAFVQIFNRGSGPGRVESLSVSGARFRAFGLPLFPLNLASGSAFQFEIRYSPDTPGDDAGSLRIQFSENSAIAAELTGTAVGSVFSHELIIDGVSTPFGTSAPVEMPATAVGRTATATVLVQNTGTAAGVVNAIAASGTGFRADDLPFLPATLQPNETLTFTLVFSPSGPGLAAGRLRIGSLIFDVRGTGLGPDLLYSFTSAGVTIDVRPGEPISFSPTPVGERAQARFSVTNVGPREANIPSIGIGGASGPFRLANTPNLPLGLQPNATAEFAIDFAPAAEVLLGAQLLVGSAVFPMNGFGLAPERRAEYRFTGDTGGNVQLLAQPLIGLSLDRAYPIAVRGTLTLTTETGSPGVDDPSIQFLTGGRSVEFTIPAESTVAVFASGSDRIRLQTGSVAGTIRIEPRFFTTAGVDLSPPTPSVLSLVAAPTPPLLRSLIVRPNLQGGGLEVIVVGIAPTRSLAVVDVTFAAAPGSKLSNATFALDLSAASNFWFSSPASAPFGGQFSVSIPFTVEGKDLPPNLGVESVTVAIANSLGRSEPIAARPF